VEIVNSIVIQTCLGISISLYRKSIYNKVGLEGGTYLASKDLVFKTQYHQKKNQKQKQKIHPVYKN
jgi:hypothetical protein